MEKRIKKSKSHRIRYRAFLSALLVVCLVFIPTFKAFAYYNGTWSDNTQFLSYFGITASPYNMIDLSTIKSDYETEHPGVAVQLSTFQRSDYYAARNEDWQTWCASPDFMISNYLSFQEQDYDLSNAYHIILCPNDMTINYSHNFYIIPDSSNQQFAWVDSWIVSDGGFQMYMTETTNGNTYHYNDDPKVASVYDNGFYMFNMNNLDPMAYRIMAFTDLNIYASSTDGSTGFTTFTGQVGDDFSFSGDNYNFNRQKVDGEITAPADPVRPDVPAYVETAKHYKDFVVNTNFVPFTDGIALNMQFNFNNYQKLNGQQFRVHVKFNAVFKDSEMSSPVNYSSGDITFKVDDLLYKFPDGKCSTAVTFKDVKDSNGGSLEHAMWVAQNHILNTDVVANYVPALWWQVLHPLANAYDDIAGTSFDSYLTESGGTPALVPEIGGQIEYLQFTSEVYLQVINSEEYSGVNSKLYNYLDGTSDTLSNDNIVNLDPPSEGSTYPGQDLLPSGGSTNDSSVTVSGGSISNMLKDLAKAIATATIESGAVQNYVNPNITAAGGSISPGAVVVQNSGEGFHLTSGQWTSYGTFIEDTAKAIQGTLNVDNMQNGEVDISDNGFLAVLEGIYSVFPKEIWLCIFAAVSTVATISVWKSARSH